MNISGGNEGEMDDAGGLSEASIDRLLAGRAPADEDTTGLAHFAQDLRALYVAPPPAAVQERHLAAIAGAVRLHNIEPQQAAPRARRRAWLATLLPAWRRNVVLSGFFGSLTAKVLVGTVAAAAATGGLAAGNLLPAPVQGVVSDIAGTVGIDLPHGDAVATPSVVPVNHAEQAARILDALVKQVTDAAGQPHAVGLPVAEAAQACASKVSAIAGELAGSVQGSIDPDQALSLAQRATAIAQEAVGCALPKPADDAGTADAGTGTADVAKTSPAAQVVSATTGAKPIVDAVADCVASLRPSIMELARWWTAKMGPAAATALASKASLIAGSAGECAGKVGTAAQTAFTFPFPMPGIAKLPAKVPAKGPWASDPDPVPAAPAPDTNAQPPGGLQPVPNPAPAAAPLPGMTPSWWNLMPGMPGMPGGTTPGTGQTNPAGPWTGMTGSWGNFGQWMPSGPWNPFQPAPQPAPKH